MSICIYSALSKEMGEGSMLSHMLDAGWEGTVAGTCHGTALTSKTDSGSEICN